jgi:hypothetical protein
MRCPETSLINYNECRATSQKSQEVNYETFLCSPFQSSVGPTNPLNPCGRILEDLIVPQLVKNFPECAVPC